MMRSLKLVAAVGLALASFASMAGYTPGAGITGTPHDWSSTGGTSLLEWQDKSGNATTDIRVTGLAWIDPATGKQGKTTVTFGQCTKCHSPHQAKSTNLLWNHTLSTNNFTWDQPATTAGTPYASFKGDTYKGPTAKCLSCHDGTLASTDGVWFNRQIVSGAKYVPAAGSVDSGHDVSSLSGSLAGSHPVAMPYPFNGKVNTYNGVTTSAGLTFPEFSADPTGQNIRLFNDDGTGNIVAGPVAGKSGMECTSCHDVHNGAQTKDQLLLRGAMTGSAANGYICTECHIK